MAEVRLNPSQFPEVFNFIELILDICVQLNYPVETKINCQMKLLNEDFQVGSYFVVLFAPKHVQMHWHSSCQHLFNFLLKTFISLL